MKPRTSLIAAFAVAIPVALLLLIATACSSTGPTATSSSLATNGQAESAGGPVEADAVSTAAREAAEPLVSSEQGGPRLLQTYCAQCHSVKLLEQTRKSRAEWEKTLSRMERYSGHLTEIETLVVLDHLAAPDRP